MLVDGREVRREDDVAWSLVNPGSHVVRVERGGATLLEVVAYVGRAGIRTIPVDAPDSEAARATGQDRHVPPPHSITESPGPRRGDLVPLLMLSGGLAFVGGGAALLVSAGLDDDGRREVERTKATVGVVVGGAGLLGATVGALLLLRSEVGTAARPSRARAAIAPIPGGALGAASFVW